MTIRFETQFDTTRLIGDRVRPDLPAQVLMLHGAGDAHRGKLAPLRVELAERGIGSTAFDFVGHGETGGTLGSSSLASRAHQAAAVVEQLGMDRSGPLSVMAASMGAHVAVQLTKRLRIERLVLVVPAMYVTDAERVPFDRGFTEIIRRPGSWQDAEGWEILARFTGRLLVIAAEEDRVIPEGVIRRYHESAVNAKTSELLVVPHTGHMLFTELRERDPERLVPIVDRISAVLKG